MVMDSTFSTLLNKETVEWYSGFPHLQVLKYLLLLLIDRMPNLFHKSFQPSIDYFAFLLLSQ